MSEMIRGEFKKGGRVGVGRGILQNAEYYCSQRVRKQC